MKKAVIIGGSNGIGLSIAAKLVSDGYHALILDKVAPEATALMKDSDYTYLSCNLLNDNDALLKTLADDPDVSCLVITAGYGRVCSFESLHVAEIRNMLTVNTVSVIGALRIFYERLLSKESFDCAVMGSIAGLVSSPLFSVYAASKAALCRFIESVNVELEASGTENRILNVSPGSIRGTRFHGGANDCAATASLAGEIVANMQSKQLLFIPDYEKTYRGVIEHYNADAHAYGKHSYRYKVDSGRVKNTRGVRVGYLSGTFDLFHLGHLNLLKRAKEQCDYLIVGVHPDASHKAKKTFIPFEERMAVVGGCRYVDKAVPSCREDSDAWDLHHYDVLFVGSDYKGTERFMRYEEYFKDKGVDIVYFDYTQGTSSTIIRENIIKETMSEINQKENNQ